MGRRTLLIAAAATVVLTAASVTAAAASRSGPGPAAWMARGPVAASSCVPPASASGTRVSVMLGDMGRMMAGVGRMMLHAVPATVPAGTVTLVAYNGGSRTHELVVLPLSADASVGSRAVGADGTVDESGSLGEASTTCGDGDGDGIAARAAGWVTLRLQPGRYELVCNLAGHYAAGMFTELDVT